jgi:hypothetical protein
METTIKFRQKGKQNLFKMAIGLMSILAMSEPTAFSQSTKFNTPEFRSNRSDGVPSEMINRRSDISYHANRFVEQDMNQEIQNQENETILSDEVFGGSACCVFENQLENLRYNAAKFVDNEIELELQQFAGSSDFISEAEAITSKGCDQEIAKYIQYLANLQDKRNEAQSLAIIWPR